MADRHYANGMPVSSPAPAAEKDGGLASWVRAAIVLMLGAYLGAGAMLPWKLAAVALGAAGVVVGVVATIKAFRGAVPVVLRVTIAVATLACLLFTLSTGLQSLFYHATSEYEQCLRGSVTDRTTAKCQREYEEKLRNLDGLPGS